jgi:hypothetical protein
MNSKSREPFARASLIRSWSEKVVTILILSVKKPDVFRSWKVSEFVIPSQNDPAYQTQKPREKSTNAEAFY